MKGKARIIEADRSQPSWDVIDLAAARGSSGAHGLGLHGHT